MVVPRRAWPMLLLSLVISGIPVGLIGVSAAPPEYNHEAFQPIWERTDLPVDQGAVSRSWLWGPDLREPDSLDVPAPVEEPFEESPGGNRTVQYFEKARMEWTGAGIDAGGVTNGLLVVEMISGREQRGFDTFVDRQPSQETPVGDPAAVNPDAPTYVTFAPLASIAENIEPNVAPDRTGEAVLEALEAGGNVSELDDSPDPSVTYGVYDQNVTGIGLGHNIANVFWDYFQLQGPVLEGDQVVDGQVIDWLFAMGLPITEPYWIRSRVGGTEKWVMTQLFERRVLTYTPDNPEGLRVEMANVGTHYYRWRYESEPPPPPPPAGTPLINEIKFWPDEGEHQWVELHMPEGAADLEGWTVTNGDKSQAAVLPSISMPPGSYLVIHFGEGPDDLDVSDGRGDYYTDDSGLFFAELEDEVALYRRGDNSDLIVDFLAWSFESSYAGQAAHDDAVAAGIWTENAYFDGLQRSGVDMTRPAGQGESVGRDRNSIDTNTPEDWRVLGGLDALYGSPGAENYHDYFDIEVEPARDLAGEQGPLPRKRWTVMFFGDGRDRDLLKGWSSDISAMEETASDNNVNIVAQLAWSSRGSLRASRYYLDIARGGEGIKSPRIGIPRGTPVDPSDPRALASFINWAKEYYPADRYAIVIAGHGLGWKATLAQGDDFLTMAELETGLSALGQPFDVVDFYSCLMGQVEVGYQISGEAKMMVASEEIMWASLGSTWETFFDELKANPGWNEFQYADRKAELTANNYSSSLIADQRNYYTIASIDVRQLQSSLVPRLNVFATNLRADIEEIEEHDRVDDNHQILIKHQAEEEAEDFQDSNFKDLRHFARLAERITPELIARGAADQVDETLRPLDEGGTVVRYVSHGSAHPEAHGLSIYFPHDLLLPDGDIRGSALGDQDADAFANPLLDPEDTDTHLYKKDANILLPRLAAEPHPMEDDPGFDFPNDSGWDEFLHRYYKPVADACIRIGNDCVLEAGGFVGDTFELSGNGSSDSDGPEDARRPGDEGNDVPAHATRGPEHYYWDFDATVDHPAPKPDYEEGQRYEECEDEDCDRDDRDAANDDRDAAGKLVTYTCTAVGEFQIRLMVWDEHHDQNREHDEDRDHNRGRHWLHFNVHAAGVIIRCDEPEQPPEEPIKRSSQDEVARGDTFTYQITVPANPELEATSEAVITDVLPEQVEFVRIVDCDGECSYDEETRAVMLASVIEPGDTVTLTIEVRVPAELPPSAPPEIVNCATVYDGVAQHTACNTTPIAEPGSTEEIGASPPRATRFR